MPRKLFYLIHRGLLLSLLYDMNVTVKIKSYIICKHTVDSYEK